MRHAPACNAAPNKPGGGAKSAFGNTNRLGSSPEGSLGFCEARESFDYDDELSLSESVRAAPQTRQAGVADVLSGWKERLMYSYFK